MLVTPIQNRITTIQTKSFNKSQMPESTASVCKLPFFADSKAFVNISFKQNWNEMTDAEKFCWAGEFNRVDVLQKMLDNGTNVNSQTESGLTALMWACNRGHEEAVDFLLNCPNIDVNIQDKSGDSALERAIYSAHENVAKKLIAHPDINVNIRDKRGCTPLIEACLLFDIDEREGIIRALLCHEDIDVNAQDDDGRTALMRTTTSSLGVGVLGALLEHPDVDVNIRDNKGETAYDMALRLNNKKAAEMIANYQRGVDRREGKRIASLLINPEKFTPEKNIWTEEKITKYFEVLVKNKKYDDAMDVLNKTPLVKLEGNKPLLDKICLTGNSDFVEAVFDYKLNKQAQRREDYDEKRKVFLENYLKPLTYEELKQDTFALNTVDGFEVLMGKEEFNPNEILENGKTLFETACLLDSEGSVAVKILSKYDNVNTENARQTGSSQIKEIIDKYQALGKYSLILDKIKSGLILSSTHKEAYEQLKTFVDSSDFKPEMTDTMGNSLLHIASTSIEDDSRGLIQKLINKGVDVNSKNITGQNPIMSAITAFRAAKDEDAKSRLLSNIKFLIDKGVSLEEQDKNGQTVFHYVCSTASIALLIMMLKREPKNILVRDLQGNRPQIYLKDERMKEIYNKYINGNGEI